MGYKDYFTNHNNNEDYICVSCPIHKYKESDLKDSKIMNFSVTSDNKYFFNDQEIAAADLETTVSQHAKDYPDGLLIQVDDNAEHGAVVKLMDSARNVGVTSISLSR